MASLSCIFCYAQIVSDTDQEELQVKYESHLMGWHNIADKGERMLALNRTLQKQLNNNNEVNEWEVYDTRKFSEKIEKALKVTPSDKQHFTFENDDFVVSASFLEDGGETSQEEVASNPDATIVERDQVDNYSMDAGDSDLIESKNEEEKALDDQCQANSVETPTEEVDMEAEELSQIETLDVEKTPSSSAESQVVGSEVDEVSDEEDQTVKDCSVKMTKLKKNVIRKMVDADISVPWYEWGHHACEECGSAVFLGSMERHLNLHSMSVAEYMEQHKIPQSDLSIPPYECLVCGVAVPHTNRKIMTHLQLHSIDMASYYFQYVQGEGAKVKPEEGEVQLVEDKVEEDVDKSSSDRIIISRNLFQKKRTKSVSESPNSSNDAKSLSSVTKRRSQILASPAGSAPKSKRSRTSTAPGGELPWYESSWHKCCECGKLTTMGSFFISHVKKEHKMVKKEYVEKYPEDKVDNAPDWKCTICDRKVSWGVRSIASHLSKAHSMCKEDYATMYIENKEDEDISEETVVGDDDSEIVLETEGLPQIQRLDSAQEVTVVFDKFCD